MFSALQGEKCVMGGSGFIAGTLSWQILLQFLADPFGTLQVLYIWSEDLHVLFFRIL